jgi:hypothetical protein
MKTIVKSISYVGLLATVLPSILVFSGAMELDTQKIIMGTGMVLWFITAPIWMKK